MEREAELQALIRKLGPEARAWLDSTLQAQQQKGGVVGGLSTSQSGGGDSTESKEQQRLSVPPIRKEMPSMTETTDLTSICSIASTQAELDPLTPNQR